MSITDELRECAAKTECASGRCEKLYRGDLDHIADRIDAELAERYVELPVDADGETIRIGDRLKAGSREFTVIGIGRCYDGFEEFGVFSQCCEGDYEWFNAEYLSHVQPDSWERIIEDAAWYGRERQFVGTSGDCERIAALVERCMRLAGGE